jgi:uncharacterized protein (DUF427 family)
MIAKPIRFEPIARRVRVELAGVTVADTDNAMLMCEPWHLPVYYLPIGDIRMDLMRQTDQTTERPHKGAPVTSVTRPIETFRQVSRINASSNQPELGAQCT